MDDLQQHRLDAVRRHRSEIENNVIDEFFSGHISRRELLRVGSVVGMSLPLLSFIAACGGTGTAPSAGQGGGVKKGGKVTVGSITPAHVLDPLKVSDQGGLVLLGQVGEYLAWTDDSLNLHPVLAESWSHSGDGSVWTFKIRQGVTFNDGTPMTAEDAAATLNMHADPANGSNALSVFKGLLSKGGAKATDKSTLQVTLDSPSGNFPYLVSSDNYNLIILPASYSGGWDKSFIGTGPWKVTNYQTNVSLSTVRNPTYWDKSNTPPLDAVDYKFYSDEQPRVLALQSGSAQIVVQFSASGGQSLFNQPNITVLAARSAAHRQIHMRTDTEPFTDKRVRQAVALALSRTNLVKGLLDGKAQIANDSPFFKLYPSTDQSVAQRQQDMARAKQLVKDAGKAGGPAVTLATLRDFEIPDLAQLVQSAAKSLGITINLNITDSNTYYGNAVFGSSPWLDSTMGITDYGHRGVPNVFLNAPLVSTGTWNAAHFKNSEYDQLYRQYVTAIDLSSQRRAAGKIEQLLLDETPIIFPYNYDYLSATQSNLLNVETTGMGHLNLRRAGLKG